MSINTTMTNLADAVRAKTGDTTPLTIDQMTNGLNAIPLQTKKTITPTTTSQVAISKGSFAAGEVIVQGDANLTSENIANGISIFGVSGTFQGQSSLPKSYNVSIDLTELMDMSGFLAYSQLDSNENVTGVVNSIRDGFYSIQSIANAPLSIVTNISASVGNWEISISDERVSILSSNLDYTSGFSSLYAVLQIPDTVPNESSIQIKISDSSFIEPPEDI